MLHPVAVYVCREVFASLDKAEGILSKQRFIAGNRFTEADLRLFVTLIRFDEVSSCICMLHVTACSLHASLWK